MRTKHEKISTKIRTVSLTGLRSKHSKKATSERILYSISELRERPERQRPDHQLREHCTHIIYECCTLYWRAGVLLALANPYSLAVVRTPERETCLPRGPHFLVRKSEEGKPAQNAPQCRRKMREMTPCGQKPLFRKNR